MEKSASGQCKERPAKLPVWQPVCHLDDLVPDAGVAVRAHGAQVAVFLIDDRLYAIDHVDPFCGAAVLGRGIVGELQGRPVVASPMYKQHFFLDTGECMEDADVRVCCWPARLAPEGVLQIACPGADISMEHSHAA
ncbi:nitrite reductase small subunit NirD [Castellaniella sp.]|uniref:nitrite reductase small subunit NirD n=1 Tax=Castellaniella sp. TaxID=1955812 RepID=UPI003C741955